MKSFLVANPKGGVGKSTLATNLAGYFARSGHRVMLGDVDRQQSAREWLRIRPPAAARIETWDIQPDKPARPPKGTTHVVLDTPAGLHGKKLHYVLGIVDRVIVPLQPSLFDILATRDFLAALREAKQMRDGVEVGIVGMRVDPRTRAAAELQRFLDAQKLPIIGYLRDTQVYVQTAAHGLTLFDLPPSRAERDLEQWQPLLAWAER
jgi:chromosome partitioning protein